MRHPEWHPTDEDGAPTAWPPDVGSILWETATQAVFVDPPDVRAALRTLLALDPELVLVSHGEPVLAGGRAALDHALAGP